MVGRTVGKYKILEQIGRGGMGTVYKALDETLDRIVAIKVLNADLLEEDAVERFRREAMTLARLSHPRIGAIHELTRDGRDLLMVMEFVSGETFEKLIERSAPLDVPEAAMLCMKVLEGLEYAHRSGVIHRDLKPANVIVTPNGEVKIMDFGIARVQGSEHLTSHGFMVGTPAYMAPEQVRGEEVDPRMDLYSIAVVLYRLLTDRLPFQGDTAIAMIHSQLNNPPTPPREFRADLPDWIVSTLSRGLSKQQTDRFQTASEFRTALEGGLTGRFPVLMSTNVEETIGPTPTPQAMPTPPSSATLSTPTSQNPATRSDAVSQPLVGESGRSPIGPTAQPAAPPAVQPLPPIAARSDSTVTLRAPHLATAGVLVLLLIVGIGVLAFLALRQPTIITQQPAESPANVSAPSAAASAADSSIPTAPPTATAPAATASAPTTATTSAAAASAPKTTSAAGGDATSAKASASKTPAAETTPSPGGTTAASGRAAGAKATGSPSTAAAPAAGSTSSTATAPSTEAAAEHFADVRTVIIDGPKTREIDAMLSLEPGAVVVRTRNDSAVLRSLDYRTITAASYARAKRPRGQKGPNILTLPENVGGSGFLGSSKHWLTLQTATEFLILRLEDRNVIRVLRSIETRTGLKVQRNQDD